jgi:sec-independent protein translocase protein TatB
MFGLTPIKLFIIIAVALVVLGPDRLPQAARQLGSAWRSLKSLQAKIESEVREAIPDLPSTSDIVRIARNPVNLLNTLADKADDDVATSTPHEEAPVVDAEPTMAAEPNVSAEPPNLAPRRPYVEPIVPSDPSLN